MRRNAARIIGVHGLLLVTTAVALPIWLGYRTYRQIGLDQDLIAAVKHRNTPDVRRLLAEGASANVTNEPAKRQSLWQCIVAEAELALQRRPSRARHGDSALAIAVSNNCTEIVCLLLLHGAIGVNDRAAISIVDPSENEPATQCSLLSAAAYNGNPVVVSQLIHAGAGVNAVDSAGKRPLHFACIGGNVPTINNLLDAGAVIDAKDYSGETSLMLAASNGHRNAVLLLLRRGADPNCMSAVEAPLMCALERDTVDPIVVRALLEAGASANWAEARGFTPLLRARGPLIEAMLLSHGANVNYHNEYSDTRYRGATALMYVVIGEMCDCHTEEDDTKCQLACLNLLLRHGADVNATDAGGVTTIMYASEFASPLEVHYLIRHGARVNLVGERGPALSWAADEGLDDNIQVLLDAGADPNLSDPGRVTPLMTASGNGNDAAVSELLDAGAHINARNRDGNTALDFAISQQNTAVIQLLKRHGGRASGRPVP